jgi:hypothetical protein
LVAVDGSALPCCTLTDSTGARLTVLGGSLMLGEGAPEAFAATPAGYYPESWVHGVPEGARVDTSGVVTLPDGSTYRIPACTTIHHATYTMILTRRYDAVDGTSGTVSDTSAGVYAWSDGGGGEGQLKVVSLLNAGLIGPLAMFGGHVDITLHRQGFEQPPASTASDPEYRFVRLAR